MPTISDEILEMLNDDMVSHGLVAQCVEQANTGGCALEERVLDVLSSLLTSGRVEMGVAKMKNPDYVEFVAWKGTVAERLRRGMDSVHSADDADKEFAYWLTLRENVDRYESIDK